MLYTLAILKTEYLPPISTFWAMNNSKHVKIETCENYQKKSTRNRAKILGANGIEVLSVPLMKGKNNKLPILDVKISYSENWQTKHIQSIRSAYGNAPYYEFYIDDICAIIGREYKYLYELNHDILQFFIQILQLEVEIKNTETYAIQYSKDTVDLRKVKFNQPIHADYIPKRYNQVFEEKHDFVPGISILDLIMCKGPESILYI